MIILIDAVLVVFVYPFVDTQSGVYFLSPPVVRIVIRSDSGGPRR